MSEGRYRAYNDFDRRAIYTGNGEPHEFEDWTGWQYEFSGSSTSTPITDDNLNAMLNMLVYIRNVIGKTGDFETKINSDADNVSQPDVDIGQNAKSIATYLKEAFNAITGTANDTADNHTLTGIYNTLKAFYESYCELYRVDNGCLNTKDNTAASQYSTALGKDTYAGLRGFRIDSGSADDKKYYIIFEGQYDSINVPVIGDAFSLQINNNYDRYGSVINIGQDGENSIYIQVDNYVPLISGETSYIWFPDNPSIGNIDLGTGASAEGYSTKATMLGAHTEGYNTHAYGKYAHAEGRNTQAAYGAHSEGIDSQATGRRSHAQNYATKASGENSTATGQGTTASGLNSFSQGFKTEAKNTNSAAFGKDTITGMDHSLVIGKYNQEVTDGLFVVGNGNYNKNTDATTRLNAFIVHEDGRATVAKNPASELDVATKYYVDSKPHISNLRDSGTNGLKQPNAQDVTGTNGVALGNQTLAKGGNAIAIGHQSEANANDSVAAGNTSKANHEASFIQGYQLNSTYAHQTVVGEFNHGTALNAETALFIVGNGGWSSQGGRSNAFTVLKDGRAQVNPKVDLSNDNDVINKKYLDERLKNYTPGGGGSTAVDTISEADIKKLLGY